MALAIEHGFDFWTLIARILVHTTDAFLGNKEAVAAGHKDISVLLSVGAAVYVPAQLAQLAAAVLPLHQVDVGMRLIEESLALSSRTQECFWDAEIHHVKGELQLLRGDTMAAEADMHAALSIARHQQATSHELRAAMSLARLWRSQQRAGEARTLLAPIHAKFTEGFDTKDLMEAKVLLDQLSQSSK